MATDAEYLRIARKHLQSALAEIDRVSDMSNGNWVEIERGVVSRSVAEDIRRDVDAASRALGVLACDGSLPEFWPCTSPVKKSDGPVGFADYRPPHGVGVGAVFPAKGEKAEDIMATARAMLPRGKARRK